MKTITTNTDIATMIQTFTQNDPVMAVGIFTAVLALVCFVAKDYI